MTIALMLFAAALYVILIGLTWEHATARVGREPAFPLAVIWPLAWLVGFGMWLATLRFPRRMPPIGHAGYREDAGPSRCPHCGSRGES